MAETKKEVRYQIGGIFNINDIKYDLLKIIEPHDGYMFNRKDSDRVKGLFDAYLGDLRGSRKIFSYSIYITNKDSAVTYDVQVQMQKERSPKKLKIHVGKLQYGEVATADA